MLNGCPWGDAEGLEWGWESFALPRAADGGRDLAELTNEKKKKKTQVESKIIADFPHRESNPGRLGENQES